MDRVSSRVCFYFMITHNGNNNKHTLCECNNSCNGADRREQGFSGVKSFLMNQIWVQFRLFFYCFPGLWSVVADGDFSSTLMLQVSEPPAPANRPPQ